MGDRALKWCLRLLGIALLIGPILVALSANNWDIKAAVLPTEEEMNQVMDSVTGVFGGGFSQDTFVIGNPSVSGNKVSLLVSFKSPFNVPIKIIDVTITVADKGVQVGQLSMQDSVVEVPVNGTANLTLVGTLTGSYPTDPQFSIQSGTFEVYGVSVHLQMGGQA